MKHKAPLWLLCAAALLISAALSVCVGSVPIFPSDIINGNDTAMRILLHVRLPRTAAAMLAGAALAVAGAVIQSVLGNPLASPNIIGVNAGAGLGYVLSLALLPTLPKAANAAAFVGALAAVLLVYGVSQKTGASRMTLILSGVAVNAMLNACIDCVTTLMPGTLSGVSLFKTGGLSGVSLAALSPAWAVILICIAALCAMNNRLDVLALGDETAKSLGLNTGVTRLVFLALASALAASAVSFAGLLGFVGLLVPHGVRFFTGGESRRLIPASAAMGAAFLAICDTLARSVFAPYELPVGILLALLGGPFFLYLLVRRRGHA